MIALKCLFFSNITSISTFFNSGECQDFILCPDKKQKKKKFFFIAKIFFSIVAKKNYFLVAKKIFFIVAKFFYSYKIFFIEKSPAWSGQMKFLFMFVKKKIIYVSQSVPGKWFFLWWVKNGKIDTNVSIFFRFYG